MAKVSLDVAEQFQNQNNNNSNNVSFFTLKNDGDEAVVRFMYDSVNDFEILTYHNVKVTGSDGRTRDMKVSCIRQLNESPDRCPLCSAGNQLIQRFFIKMLQYDKNEAGGVTAKPVVWERNTQYALKLREYLNNYGPLSDIICKIVRHGASGSMQTTYEIIPNLNKSIYRDDIYVKDTSVIGAYTAFGPLVKDKSAEDMYTYLQTGQFPEVQKQSDNDGLNGFPAGTLDTTNLNYNSTGYVPPQQSYTYATQQAQAQVVQQPVTAAPPVAQQIPQQRMPWQNQQNAVQRPIRSY